MTARICTPDATGRCMVCGRPEAEHSRSGGWEGDEARCMPEPGEADLQASLSAALDRATETHNELCDRIGAHDLRVGSPGEVTVETVRDEQIRAFLSDPDLRLAKAARCATGASRGGVSAERRARYAIVDAINARAKEVK